MLSQAETLGRIPYMDESGHRLSLFFPIFKGFPVKLDIQLGGDYPNR